MRSRTGGGWCFPSGFGSAHLWLGLAGRAPSLFPLLLPFALSFRLLPLQHTCKWDLRACPFASSWESMMRGFTVLLSWLYTATPIGVCQCLIGVASPWGNECAWLDSMCRSEGWFLSPAPSQAVLTRFMGLLRPCCRLPLGPPPKFRAGKSWGPRWDWKPPLSGYMRWDRSEGSFPRPAGEWPWPPPRPLPPPMLPEPEEESCLRPKPRPPVALLLRGDLCPAPQPEPEKAESRFCRILADPKAEPSKPLPPPVAPMSPKPTPPRWAIMSPRESAVTEATGSVEISGGGARVERLVLDKPAEGGRRRAKVKQGPAHSVGGSLSYANKPIIQRIHSSPSTAPFLRCIVGRDRLWKSFRMTVAQMNI